jgi:hypothetical protein
VNAPHPRRAAGDRGQALPVYITVVGALLFLAFAFFAVGQAGSNKDGARTAADAAALAAAQDRAGLLHDRFVRDLGDGSLDGIGQVLDGVLPGAPDSCDRARRFAAENGAAVTDCTVTPDGEGYAVGVRNDTSVGTSVVPGTEAYHSVARATAELTPLCTFSPAPGASTAPTATPSATATARPGSPSPSAGAGPAGTLHCRGGTFTVDPSDPAALPRPADLFHVHLTS